ncbi:MAG: diphthamide synthesis protein [Nanoarchaeota archaeon]|nr:diphthamide synthesis protein [Nanoarchaeota archaeon]
MKVLYDEVSYVLKHENKLLKLVNSYKNSFVATTIQFKPLLKRVKSKNKAVVLGCNVSSIKDFKGDIIIFIGDGEFHALMIKKMNLNKKVIAVNPFNLSKREIRREDIKKFEFREAVAMDALKNANNVGIIVTTKYGQSRMKDAVKIKKDLEKKGKKVYLFLFETVNPDEFLNFKGLDCLINTACPRMALDDYTKFPAPVINVGKVL